MTPTILDKDGKGEIREGVQVERSVNGARGGIVGTVLAATKLDVLVEWPGGHHRFYKHERHSLLPRTYRCPDLQLAAPTQ